MIYHGKEDPMIPWESFKTSYDKLDKKEHKIE